MNLNNLKLDELNTPVKMVAGKLNNCRTILYWLADLEDEIKIGDYAIVENMSDYDLVKIVGIVATSYKYIKFITNCSYAKKVVRIIKRNEIRED